MVLCGRCTVLATGLMLAAAVAFARPGFRDSYELGRRTHEFNQALAAGDARAIYRLFNPAFRSEIPFARFDSAFQNWLAGRRIRRVGRRIIDIRPPSSAVSVYYYFQGERDYGYLYQNWIYNQSRWELAWVSRILDNSFQYGQSDTAGMRSAVETALRWLAGPEGLAVFRSRLLKPAVIVMLRRGLPGEGELTVPGSSVVWVTSRDIRNPAQLPPVPHYYALALVRLMDSVAQVSFDLYPTDPANPGRLGRHRSVEIFLTRRNGGWTFASRGRIW